MTDLQITTLVPQTSDNERMLLARLLSGTVKPRSAGSGLALGARTTTTSTTWQSPIGFRSLTATMLISAAGAAGGLTMRVEGQDADGNIFVLAQDSARTTPLLTALQVSSFALQSGAAAIPGNPAISGRAWDINGFSGLRVSVQHSTADSYTYKVNLVFS